MSTFITSKQIGAICAAAAALGACVVGAAYYRARNRSTVKSFNPFTPQSPEAEHPGFDCTRDRFSKRKIPEELDVIVVGSGIGGLYCAALLARAGKRVLVLEQHYVAGGCTHCFEDMGWEFDTGVHYVGRIQKYGYLLDMVSDGPKVQWKQLGTAEDGYVYDELKLGDSPAHKLRAGKEAFLADLIAKFPGEERGLRQYVQLVAECSGGSEGHFFGKLFPRWLQGLLERTVGAPFQRLAALRLSEVLDHLFQSRTLKALLSSQFGDYGLPPDQASFYIHAAVVAHYMDGAYYPVGGPQMISRALIPTIVRAGGRVLVNAPVKRLLRTASGAVCGVEVDGSLTQIFAPTVVSAAGAFATEQLLEGAPALPPVTRFLLGGISHVYAFIGIEGSSEQLRLPSSNTWVLPSEDISEDCCRYYTDPFARDKQLMFIGFPSAKDPMYSKKYKGKSNCVVITEAVAEWFDEFKGTDIGMRPKAYEDLKLRFKNRLLKGLYELYPQLNGRVRYCEIGTPLTNSFYLRRAASYGLAHPPFRYTAAAGLRPQTDVPGLWLTGQDVATSGFAGAMMGGLLTAHGVLGYGAFDLLVCGTNLITDMEKMLRMQSSSQSV